MCVKRVLEDLGRQDFPLILGAGEEPHSCTRWLFPKWRAAQGFPGSAAWRRWQAEQKVQLLLCDLFLLARLSERLPHSWWVNGSLCFQYIAVKIYYMPQAQLLHFMKTPEEFSRVFCFGWYCVSAAGEIPKGDNGQLKSRSRVLPFYCWKGNSVFFWKAAGRVRAKDSELLRRLSTEVL